MLQTIREHAQGWIAWVIVILLIIPFAFWGIQSYLGISSDPVVATVDGFEVSENAFEQQLRQTRIELREQLGANYDPDQFGDAELREQVLDEMVREVLLLNASQRLGLGVSDQELKLQILSEPAFQRDGRFDRDTYEQMLRIQGMTPALFEARLRQQIVGTQLPRTVVESAFLSSVERADYQRLSRQQRAFDYGRFALADYLDPEDPIEDDEIQRYYQTHGDAFRSPEQVRLDYLILDAKALASEASVEESSLREAYEADQARFIQPERRAVRHLLLTLPADADTARREQVQSEIEALRVRIEAGEPFADLAREHSQDPGSAERGGSLGTLTRDTLEAPFAEVAFSLEPGQLSEPVRTRFGLHLIEVESVEPAEVSAFETVRDQLHDELAREQGESMYYEIGERLASLAYETPDSLEPVAEELGLEMTHSDWISREGGEGILASPKIMAAAFSPEVLDNGNNSDLIEPEPDALRAVVVRVMDHRPASVRALDEVRAEIVDAIRNERAREAAREAAEAAAEALRAGQDWATLTGLTESVSPGLVDRLNGEVPTPVRELAFTLPAPGEGQSAVGVTALDAGDAVLVRLTEVRDGEVSAEDAPRQDPESRLIAQLLGRHLYDAMLDDMERRASIERKPFEPETP